MSAQTQSNPGQLSARGQHVTNNCFPASGLQLLNWQHQQKISKGLSRFQEPEVLLLNLRLRELHFSAFESAYRALITRHENLRSVFFMEEDKLMQRVLDYQEHFFDTLIYDIAAAPVKETLIREATRKAMWDVCNLETGPLIRSLLFKVSQKECWFVSVTHHIVSDARSLEIIKSDLFQLYKFYKYNKPLTLEPIRYTVEAYNRRQLALVTGSKGLEEKVYWIERFRLHPLIDFSNFYKAAGQAGVSIEDANQHLDLRRFLREKPENGANTLRQFLEPETNKRVMSAAQRWNITPFVFIMGGFCMMMRRLNGQQSFLIASSVNDRRSVKMRNMIGHLMCKVYLDLKLTGHRNVVEFMNYVYADFLRATRHPLYQEKDYEELNVPRQTSLYINYSDKRSIWLEPNPAAIHKHESANRSCYALSAVIHHYKNCVEINWL
ncbi:MAG: hypothetical protein KGO82_18020, partial [Bacteroidota bacterium]|nr:hypothetical protein [Bacteroidota bacterium]